MFFFPENVEMKSGEITKEGFLQLNKMEAEDNNGDTEDLWITLNNMGYNKVLEMDEVIIEEICLSILLFFYSLFIEIIFRHRWFKHMLMLVE